jgi:hypothetical protein
MISMARRTSMHPDAFHSPNNARRSSALSDRVIVASQGANWSIRVRMDCAPGESNRSPILLLMQHQKLRNQQVVTPAHSRSAIIVEKSPFTSYMGPETAFGKITAGL